MHGNNRRYRIHSAGVTFECIAPRGSYCLGILKSLYNNATIEPVFDEQDDGVVHPTGGSIATEEDEELTEEDFDDDLERGDDKENQGDGNANAAATEGTDGNSDGEGGGSLYCDDDSEGEEEMQECDPDGEDRGWKRFKVDPSEGSREDTGGSSVSYARVRHSGPVPDKLQSFIERLGDRDFRRRYGVDGKGGGGSGATSNTGSGLVKEQEEDDEDHFAVRVSDLYSQEDGDKQTKKN